ncbi:CPBP family intramembrane glutamic endopeptidase [Lactobacillus sp. Sy-1]|uniref:CPBP family intramembrane glutamic endopeptidase n=1 Tax=Lactobacillus sp. Sy-1 TaxID=2109645 RepID=UPI001C57DD3B|nr:type II CAAX endopeptidase family protein [Lactobacillus sp. Sy-1]MBW1605270.1 CPBP family intramembrane metalloprotease [Lactobacillus sp. Sy-1]
MKKGFEYLKIKLRDILKWVGFLVIYQISLGLILLMPSGLSKIAATEWLFVGIVVTAFVLSFTIWRYRKQLQAHNPFHFARHKFNGKAAGQLLLLIGALVLIQGLWQVLLNAKVISEPNNQKLVEASIKKLFLVNYLYAGIIAPIFEEVIFRGIFFNYFFKLTNGRLSKTIGVLVCGGIFGYMHTTEFDLNWIFYSAIGWVLSITYLHFKDIRYNIAIHMLNNLI